MVDKLLRYPKEQVLLPLARGPLRGVHPTAITLLACVAGLGCAWAAWQRLSALALGLWLLNRTLDGLDGTVARANGRQSDLGGYLDILLDVLVYAAVPLGLALGAGTGAAYLALALLLGSFYLNGASWMYLSALLEKRGRGARAAGELTTVTMPTGLVEGAETVLFYALALLLPAQLVPLFALMALLVLLTAVQRLIWALGHL